MYKVMYKVKLMFIRKKIQFYYSMLVISNKSSYGLPANHTSPLNMPTLNHNHQGKSNFNLSEC